MSSIAAIHVARKQLGLEEDDYRAVLARVTGKSSSADMSEAERQAVLEEFRRLGFTKGPTRRESGSRAPRKRLEGRFAAKLQALWIAGWNLGLVRERDDSALIAFVRRQTGIDHVRFVRDADDAGKAIEALKGWLAREGGVDWTRERALPAVTQLNGFRIAQAQFAILKRRGDYADLNSLAHWLVVHRRVAGAIAVDQRGAREADWIPVMNALGAEIRKSKGESHDA